MSQALQLGHFGLRTRNLPAAIEWYAKALNARVHFRNELAAFMSFDEEHHRFVLWDDGETGEKPEDARGVDHIGFGCGGPSELADQYDRLKNLGIMPTLCVNHHFTSSIYYRDPDGNEVELSVDNFPTKTECDEFIRSEKMNEIGYPPFGCEFDAEELARLYHQGVPDAELAKIGIA